MNITFEVTCSFRHDPAKAALLGGVLAGLGVGEHEIAEQDEGSWKSLSVYTADRVQAMRLQRRLKSLALKHVDISLRRLRDADWQCAWKQDFKPFMLTDRIRVVPAGSKYPETPGVTNVYVDTDIVFGTGMHPTTRETARFIERCRGRFESLLDIGTGTGLLAIVGRLNGASRIRAVDISRDAVDTAARNFAANGCTVERLDAVDFRHFKTGRRFDFVCANLLTGDLIDMRKKIVSCVRAGGYLAVSGVSAKNYPSFRARFDSSSLRCLRISRSDGWTAVLYRRTNV